MFVWLPTGFVKSIYYQALPLVIEYTGKGNVEAHSAIATNGHLFYVKSNLPHRWLFVVFFLFIRVTSLSEVITRQYYGALLLRSNARLELVRIHYLADNSLSSPPSTCCMESLGT